MPECAGKCISICGGVNTLNASLTNLLLTPESRRLICLKTACVAMVTLDAQEQHSLTCLPWLHDAHQPTAERFARASAPMANMLLGCCTPDTLSMQDAFLPDQGIHSANSAPSADGQHLTLRHIATALCMRHA